MQVANRGVRQRGGAFYDPTAYSYFDLPLMIFAMAMMPRGLEAGASESDGDAPVLFDPFDRGNPSSNCRGSH